MTDLPTYLFPAFVAAACFLLIVGTGILVLVRARYPVGHVERPAASRDLARAGWVIVIVAIAGVAPALWTAPSVGTFILLVPAAILLDGAAFVLVAGVMSRSSR